MADDEALLPVAEAFFRTTGRRPSPASWHRWRLRGIGGIRLQTTRYGGRRMCSVADAKRFLEATTLAADGEQAPPLESRSNRSREASIAAAERELNAAGA